MVSRKAKFWSAGVVLAIAGIALARGLSRVFDEPTMALVIYAVGALVAIAGLILIGVGLTQR